MGAVSLAILKPKNLSRRHHFIPKFYLKAWYEAKNSGFWVYTKTLEGELVAQKNKHAKSYCFEDDLYLLKPDGNSLVSSETDILEKEFFLPIDTRASSIHKKLLLTGISSLTAEDRINWAIFMLSLQLRSPEAMLQFVEQMRNELFNYDNFELLARNAYLSNLPAMMLKIGAVEYITNMDWSIVKLPAEKEEHLLLGNNPLLIMPSDERSPIQVFSLAISPKQLLVMTVKDEEFDEGFCKLLPVYYSLNVINQSEKYIISFKQLQDEAHLKYKKMAQLWSSGSFNNILFG